jgi:hypothetical protein
MVYERSRAIDRFAKGIFNPFVSNAQLGKEIQDIVRYTLPEYEARKLDRIATNSETTASQKRAEIIRTLGERKACPRCKARYHVDSHKCSSCDLPLAMAFLPILIYDLQSGKPVQGVSVIARWTPPTVPHFRKISAMWYGAADHSTQSTDNTGLAAIGVPAVQLKYVQIDGRHKGYPQGSIKVADLDRAPFFCGATVGSSGKYIVERSYRSLARHFGKSRDPGRSQPNLPAGYIFDDTIFAPPERPTANPETYYRAALEQTISIHGGGLYLLRLLYVGYDNSAGVNGFTVYVSLNDRSLGKTYASLDLPWSDSVIRRRIGIGDGDEFEFSIEAHKNDLEHPHFVLRRTRAATAGQSGTGGERVYIDGEFVGDLTAGEQPTADGTVKNVESMLTLEIDCTSGSLMSLRVYFDGNVVFEKTVHVTKPSITGVVNIPVDASPGRHGFKVKWSPEASLGGNRMALSSSKYESAFEVDFGNGGRFTRKGRMQGTTLVWDGPAKKVVQLALGAVDRREAMRRLLAQCTGAWEIVEHDRSGHVKGYMEISVIGDRVTIRRGHSSSTVDHVGTVGPRGEVISFTHRYLDRGTRVSWGRDTYGSGHVPTWDVKGTLSVEPGGRLRMTLRKTDVEYPTYTDKESYIFRRIQSPDLPFSDTQPKNVNFCSHCGVPAGKGKFCTKCGKLLRSQ